MDDTNARLREAIVVPTENAINEHVEATMQFQVDEGLGTIPHGGFGPVRGTQQVEQVVGPPVEAAVTEAIRGIHTANDETA